MPGAAGLQEYLTPHFPPAGKAPIIYIMSSNRTDAMGIYRTPSSGWVSQGGQSS
jgi:hypothetical protein